LSNTEPTQEEIDAANAVLAKANLAKVDRMEAPRKAMVELVTMPEYDKVFDAMNAAFQLDPANTDVSYTMSMLARIRNSYKPAE
jgi:hypothetical protein